MTDWTPTPEQSAAAFALVGEFMHAWSFVEYELNRSVILLSGIEGGIDGFIVTTNMGVRDKLNTVRTFLNHGGSRDEVWRKATAKMLDKIGARVVDRNLIAHTSFSPHQKGGVVFVVTKAKSKFDTPDVVWTPQIFQAKVREMLALAGELKTRTKEAKGARQAMKWFLAGLPSRFGGLPKNQPPAAPSSPRTKRARSPQPGGKAPKK